MLNVSQQNASDKDAVKLAKWATTLHGLEEHLMTCVFGMLPTVIWATILSLIFEKAEKQFGEYHLKYHNVPYYLDIVSNRLEIYDLGIISAFSTLRR